MPTYAYLCDSCGHGFERFQSITEKPVKDCPRCSKAKVRRLITGGAGVLFRGSGFYQTDYRSKGYQEAEKKEKAEKKNTPETPSSGPSPRASRPVGPEATCKQPKVCFPDKK